VFIRPIAPKFGRELDARATIVGILARQRKTDRVHRYQRLPQRPGRMSTGFPHAWFPFAGRDAIARENADANLADPPSSMADSHVSSNRVLPHFLAIEDEQAGIGTIKSVALPPWASAMRRNSKYTEPKLYRPSDVVRSGQVFCTHPT
jgi:hypothetical protein